MNELLAQIKTHPWLGQALLGIAAILGLYAVLITKDMAAEERARYQALSSQLGRLQQVSREPFWEARLTQVNSRLGQYQSRLWQAPTTSVAQAQIQDRINLMAKRHRLENFRLQPAGTAPGPVSGIRAVSVRLEFGFASASLLPLLGDLLHANPPFTIAGLDFQLREHSRATIDVTAYSRIAGQAE